MVRGCRRSLVRCIARRKRAGARSVPVLASVLVASAGGAALGQADVRLEGESCCDAELNVGFSERAIKDGPPFAGIVGLGERCLADEGEVIAKGARDQPNFQDLFVNVISNLEGGRHIQGWSFGIALAGQATVVSVSIGGTAAARMPQGYACPDNDFPSTYTRTNIIDPAKNGGLRGVVSVTALTTQGLSECTLPSVGTQSLLRMTLQSESPQGAADQVATLRFQTGLIGRGQPVDNVFTVNGDSNIVCNLERARVSVVFRGFDGSFRRGDANADTRVNISDHIWILSELFLGGPASDCADAADANDDGVEDISDALYLLNFLFLGTNPAPAAPGPTLCGFDPTVDDLVCGAAPAGCT
jgi:hypothetical protein